MRKVHRRRVLAASALVAILGACSEDGPAPGPGTLTATLTGVSSEPGAAVLVLVGEGIDSVFPVGNAQVFMSRQPTSGDADEVRVVVVSLDGAQLSFALSLDDVTQRPRIILEEVAGTDDQLRDPNLFTLELGR